MEKHTTLTKRYLSHPFLSHTIVSLTGTNLPTGIQDPAEESQTEEEAEAERYIREENEENKADL